jgi:hypothetical protein
MKANRNGFFFAHYDIDISICRYFKIAVSKPQISPEAVEKGID